jgi:lipid II:glycine glycyltransferase (peptidoglycan interpeptide bridge formation enzyme)
MFETMDTPRPTDENIRNDVRTIKMMVELLERYNPVVVVISDNVKTILDVKWESRIKASSEEEFKTFDEYFVDADHRRRCIDHINSYFYRIAKIELSDFPMHVVLASVIQHKHGHGPDIIDTVIDQIMEVRRMVVTAIDEDTIITLTALMLLPDQRQGSPM